MSNKKPLTPSRKKRIQDLLMRQKLIHNQLNDLFCELDFIEELVETMLQNRCTKPEALEIMAKKAKEL